HPRYEAHRRLAVLAAPARVCACPHRRLKPQIARDTRRSYRHECRNRSEHAGKERLTDVRHTVRSVSAREQITALPQDAEVQVSSVADPLEHDDRRERGPHAVTD